MGWVICDAQGSLCAQGASVSSHVASALSREALALRAAFRDVSSRNPESVLVKSDSKTLVGLINTNSMVNELVGLLHDIRVLASSLHVVSFQFIPRTANMLADAKARTALASLVVLSFSFVGETNLSGS